MPVTSLDEFWQKIVAANLLSPEEVSRFRRGDAGGRGGDTSLPGVVAERLVKAGALTGWQANMLLAGQDRFFLGRYKLLEKLGEGGMGSVFKAEQVPLGRIVALKVMSEKLVSSEGSVARFRREIQSAAALQHPHIVLAYDADCVGDVHFLVMEYVDGEDLARLVKRRGALPAGEACHYVVQAAEGLDHAHRRGMVHRDIKPGNLLLTSRGVHPREQDGGDQPRRSPTPSGSPGGIIKILDFGLAKLEEQSETAHDLTATGQVLGTPDYMAPEQARNTRDADVRSDVYALGCTLFRLIGGRVPFPEGNVMERLMAKAMDDAPRLKSLRPEIPDALDAVVAKMLSRDPDQRYQTPAEVAAALTPFAERPQQAGTIVSATPRDGPNVAGPAGTGTGLEPVTEVEPAYARFLDLLTREADEDATQATGSAQLAETIAEPADGGDAALLEDLRPRQRRPERPPGRGARSTKVQRELAARSRKDRRRLRRMASVAVAFTAVIAGLALWHKTGETQFVTDWSADDLNVVTLKVDGREQSFTGTQQLVYRGRPGRYQLMLRRDGYHDIDRTWTLTRGESVTFRPEWKPTAATIRKSELAALKKRVDDYVQARRRTRASRGVHPPGNNGGDRGDEPRGSRGDAQIAKLRSDLLAFRRRYYDKLDDCLTVAQLMSRLPWPADQLQRKDIDPYELQAAEIATGGAAASRGVHPPGNNGAARGDKPRGSPLPELVAILGDSRLKHWSDVHCVAFRPDGKTLASGGADGIVSLWDVETGRQRRGFHLPGRFNQVAPLAFSPDGKTVAAGSYAIVRLWNVETGQQGRELQLKRDDTGGHANYTYSVAFSPDGKLLATGSAGGGTVKLWDLTSGKERFSKQGNSGVVLCVAFSPDGKRLAIAGQGAKDQLKLWDTTTGAELQTLAGHTHNVHSAAFSPDGKILASGSADQTIRLWETATGKELKTLTGHTGIVTTVAFGPKGRTLASCSQDNTIRLWDVANRREIAVLRGHVHDVLSVAFSPDGKTLGSGGVDGTVRLWDVATGKETIKTGGHPPDLKSVAVSPDGTLVATNAGDRVAALYDLSTGKRRHTLSGHTAKIAALAFSPDSRLLVTGSYDGTARVWNVSTGKQTLSYTNHGGIVRCVAFSPDGKTIASGGYDHRVRVWKPSTGQELRTLQAPHSVYALAFSPDGKLLLFGGNARTLQLWEVSRGRLRREWKVDEETLSVMFCPDGLSAASNMVHVTQFWDIATGTKTKTPAEFRRLMAFSPDGRRFATSPGDGTIKVWEIQTARSPASRTRRASEFESRVSGKLLKTLQLALPGSRIFQVAFTPDGRHLVTANGNGTVYVLRLRGVDDAEKTKKTANKKSD